MSHRSHPRRPPRPSYRDPSPPPSSDRSPYHSRRRTRDRIRYDDEDRQPTHSERRHHHRPWLDEERNREIAGVKESMWERRGRQRDRARVSPVWGRSPSPPRRLEERFEVGADERKRKERRRKRKEERRLRRDGKRLKGEDGGGGSVERRREELNERVDGEVEEEEEEVAEVVGPCLPVSLEVGGGKGMDYGKALRPGEGTAMAAFVQDGVRIPRRGEIGLDGKQIEKFEEEGYVMSGSRHRRMEAVRMRKENQVYSAEEMAALSQFSHEERRLREQQMLNQFRVLVESKVGGAERDEKSGAER